MEHPKLSLIHFWIVQHHLYTDVELGILFPTYHYSRRTHLIICLNSKWMTSSVNSETVSFSSVLQNDSVPCVYAIIIY